MVESVVWVSVSKSYRKYENMFSIFRIERLCCKIHLKILKTRSDLKITYCTVQLLAKTFSRTKTWKVRKDEQELFLNSLTAENQDEYLAKTVSPYWNLTYDEQLEKKQNSCSVIVDMIVKRAESSMNPMTCKLLQIIPSPVTRAYRNKDEFNVREGIDGNPKTVGFTVGKPSIGRALSVHPTKIITIKESHKRVAQVYEDFIRLSPLPANIVLHDGGHWRTLVVRSNEAGDIMACVTVYPKGYTIKTIQEEQQALKEYFFKHLPNITLFHQQCPNVRCTHDIAPFNLLYGKPYLMETLNGYKFKISPDSFFQINKLGAEVLYDTIIRMAKLKPNTTVLDICSGTGTISIMVSKFVRGTVGIESVSQAVTDAKYNAQFNNIHNVNFLFGRVEKELKSVLKNLNASSDIVAIVNPGRAGLGIDFMRAIRTFLQVSRVVYLDTCNSDTPKAIDNFEMLCSTKKTRYPSFRLTKVIPVDLYPQSTEFQLIVLFEGSSLTNYSK